MTRPRQPKLVRAHAAGLLAIVAVGCARRAVTATSDDAIARDSSPDTANAVVPIRIGRMAAMLGVTDAFDALEWPDAGHAPRRKGTELTGTPRNACAATDSACVWRFNVIFSTKAMTTTAGECTVHAVTGSIACSQDDAGPRIVGTADPNADVGVE